MSVVVQTAPIEDADTDADDRDNLHNANDMDSDLELDNHMSPARIRNQEQEGEGGEETGTGSATTSVRGIQIEQMHPNDMAGLTTKIQHILDNVHQAWGIANINMLLDAAIRPSAWTERPAKQLSKLARATGVDQRAWAIGQLGQLARGRPLNKSIIQQVYDQAVAEGKLALGRSSQRSRAPASVPETPQAQKQQRRRRQQQQQQQTSTGSSQRGAPSANPTAGRAASIELGQSPPSNSRLQTAEAQGDDSESELIPDYNVRSLVSLVCFHICLFVAQRNFVLCKVGGRLLILWSIANRLAPSTQLTRLVFAPGFAILNSQTSTHSQCCTHRNDFFAIGQSILTSSPSSS